MKFEDVFFKHIGHFGRFQCFVAFYVSYSAVPLAFHMMSYIAISGGGQPHWCALPAEEYGNVSQKLLKEIYIPIETKSGRKVYSSCDIYDLDDGYVNETIHRHLLETGNNVSSNASDVNNQKTKRRCEKWDYGRNELYKSSLMTQFSLYCDKEWLIPLSQTSIMSGWLAGNFIFGSLADRFGRIRVAPWGFLASAVTGIVTPFIPDYYAYLVFRFILGLTTGGPYTVLFVHLMEMCSKKYRVFYHAIFNFGFNSAVMLFSAIAYAMSPVNHYWMQLIFGCVSIFLIFTGLLLPESPRWLVSNHQYERAKRIVRRIARLNDRPIPDVEKINFEEEAVPLKDKSANFEEEKTTPVKKYSMFDLFRTPNIRRITLASYLIWFTCAFIFYGLIFIGGSLGANIYINTLISGANGVISSFVAIPMQKYFGRRPTNVLCLFFMTVCLVISIFLMGKPEFEKGLIAVAFFGKFWNILAFDAIYLHSAEIFPTCIRSVGVGTGSLWARLGGLLAPLMAKTTTIWTILPVIVFSSVGTLATFVSILLPETRERHLPDTIEEGEKFARFTSPFPSKRCRHGGKGKGIHEIVVSVDD